MSGLRTHRHFDSEQLGCIILIAEVLNFDEGDSQSVEATK